MPGSEGWNKLGLKGMGGKSVQMGDNELRYILWRSYKNLESPGEYRDVFKTAEDVAMRDRLGIDVEREGVEAEGERAAEEGNDVLFSLGAPYQGSKNRVAEKIIDRLPEGERFVDLFSGGGAMTHAAINSGKYAKQHMNDIDDTGQRLFIEGAEGKWRDRRLEPISEEEFERLKNSDEGRPEAILRSVMA